MGETRRQKVTVELTIVTAGNHKYAAKVATERLRDIGGSGCHVDEGFYEYEIVRARASGTGDK